MYNATKSLLSFENKVIFFYLLLKNAQGYYNAGVVFVNSEVVVGLSPGFSSSSADASGFSWTDSIILPNSN
jgi:hypothetical protein